MSSLGVIEALTELLRVIDAAADNRGYGLGYLAEAAGAAREALADQEREAGLAGKRSICDHDDALKACELFVEYDESDDSDDVGMMIKYDAALTAAKAALARNSSEAATCTGA